MHLKHLIAYTGWKSIIPLRSTTKTIQNMHAVRFAGITTYLSKRWPCWPGSWSPSPRRSVSWSGSSGRTCRWWPLARSLPPSRGHKCTWNIHWWVKVPLWKRFISYLSDSMVRELNPMFAGVIPTFVSWNHGNDLRHHFPCWGSRSIEVGEGKKQQWSKINLSSKMLWWRCSSKAFRDQVTLSVSGIWWLSSAHVWVTAALWFVLSGDSFQG